MARNLFGNLRFPHLVATLFLIVTASPAQAIDLMGQQPPQAPTKVSTSSKNRTVYIEWDEAATPSIVEYRVFRFDNIDPERKVSQIASVPKLPKRSRNRYADTTTETGRTYTYFLTSKDGFGSQSNNSNLSTVVSK